MLRDPSFLAAAALLSLTGLRAADDLLIADFEGPDYGAWKVTGQAFGSGPARGTLPGQMAVEGFKGTGLVNSFHLGDDATGTLTSPEFRLERKFIAFLIGGGQHPKKLAVQMLVDGRVVRSATGPNDRPGGSEASTRPRPSATSRPPTDAASRSDGSKRRRRACRSTRP